jgi:predicted Rossmann fold nucleotide-binding protein DprA/Smf involved in DNA uptake
VHSTDIQKIHISNERFSAQQRAHLAELHVKELYLMGNAEALFQPSLALFCSAKCPGSLILQTYDLMNRLRDGATVVISGFHSPIEKECLRILLRGSQPVIVCPPRTLEGMRIPPEQKQANSDGRVLYLSIFSKSIRRGTVATSVKRNELIAALAEKVFVPYAEPGSKTEQFCKKIIGWGRPLYTLTAPYNQNLLVMGAREFGTKN